MAAANPHIPNFFLAGAPKAGTTSLYDHLRQHPEIFMCPVKEPSYFSFETRLENFSPDLQTHLRRQLATSSLPSEDNYNGNTVQPFIESWEQYLALFQRAGDFKAIGEASVSYLWSKTAAREIASRIPHAKILLVLRNPADRAFSQYVHNLSEGHISHPFHRHITEALRTTTSTLSLYHPFLEYGLYGEQVERFLAFFPREQVRVWLYEDTLAKPESFHREILTFLGADSSFSSGVSRRLHEMEVPRAVPVARHLRRSSLWTTLRSIVPAAAKPFLKRAFYRKTGALHMNQEDRRFLLEYYHDDLKRLERVIERDLTHWFR